MSDEILQQQPKKRAFLAALGETGSITKAAKAAKIHRQTHYDWLKADEDGTYAADVVAAEQQFADLLEEEARRRAYDGWNEPVYQGGKKVGVIRKHSDTLLIFLLKGAKPEKFKDRVANQVTGVDGNPLSLQIRVTKEQYDAV